ncbi:MAG: peptidylprolyl isomerase [Candidatus Symbiothrix sp.]|nr:peptidylprolyl isomerase [Candidatus Symbiothrix sp.]
MALSCQSEAQTYTIETSLGNIQFKLYEKTPLHKANFEKLIEAQAYDNVLFHRIIKDFMIQTGDLSTKPGADLSAIVEEETIPAEFVPEYIHKKGALAAARTGDQVNPELRSSPTQFYIVQGKTYSEDELAQIEAYTGKSYTPEEKAIYTTTGGTPFLDNNYTVFGEVIDGLDVVEKISLAPTTPRDSPLEDIRILKITKD